VLTCAAVNKTATTATCNGMKLNGLDARLAPTEANTICNAVTGKGYSTANGMGVAATPYLVWNGTTWALGTAGASPMQNVTCNL
jgi:hypothetical protein